MGSQNLSLVHNTSKIVNKMKILALLVLSVLAISKVQANTLTAQFGQPGTLETDEIAIGRFVIVAVVVTIMAFAFYLADGSQTRRHAQVNPYLPPEVPNIYRATSQRY